MVTLIKIQEAIMIIKNSKIKKKGRNDYSNYNYFLPEQIEKAVYEACNEIGLITKFQLKRNELGIYGLLSIYDNKGVGEVVEYEMASDIPSITATNISQQLGGAMTFTKRYMLMNAFDISDSNLDFDTTKNTKTYNSTQKNTIIWLTEEQFKKAINSDVKGISATLEKYSTKEFKMKKSFKSELEDKLNEII